MLLVCFGCVSGFRMVKTWFEIGNFVVYFRSDRSKLFRNEVF